MLTSFADEILKQKGAKMYFPEDWELTEPLKVHFLVSENTLHYKGSAV